MKIEAVDLYCGAGGLTYGLQQAGITVNAGVDIAEECRYAYEHNNASLFVKANIEDIAGSDLAGFFSDGTIRLLAGCAPCQPFSTYRKGADAATHSKWGLLREFERLTLELEPDLVTMENVPQLAGHQPFQDFVSTLKEMRYEIAWDVVNCADFGVPQHRKRLVLIASRIGPIPLPLKTHESRWVSVRAKIGSLQEINAGERDPTDQLHCSASLSQVNMARIRASIAGGFWRDWPNHLIADCHKRAGGRTFRSVYGRMNWDQPAPTMTTLCFGFGNGRFGHPQQDRAISLREAAMLQSFPPHYSFVEEGGQVMFKRVGRMIGNAVPPALGHAIGSVLVEHVAKL